MPLSSTSSKDKEAMTQKKLKNTIMRYIFIYPRKR